MDDNFSSCSGYRSVPLPLRPAETYHEELAELGLLEF